MSVCCNHWAVTKQVIECRCIKINNPAASLRLPTPSIEIAGWKYDLETVAPLGRSMAALLDMGPRIFRPYKSSNGKEFQTFVRYLSSYRYAKSKAGLYVYQSAGFSCTTTILFHRTSPLIHYTSHDMMS